MRKAAIFVIILFLIIEFTENHWEISTFQTRKPVKPLMSPTFKPFVVTQATYTWSPRDISTATLHVVVI